MAKINEISVEVARTYNMGNYESLKIEGSVTATIEDGDSIDEVREKASEWLKKTIKREYENYRRD